MLTYPKIDPIALQAGPLEIRWYGLMYLLSFLLVLYLGRRKVARGQGPFKQADQMDEVLMYGLLGVIFGGKIGYWLFYQPSIILERPLELLTLWHPGMSFHGGVLGVALGIAFYAKRQGLHFIDITDFFMPLVPIGLGLGRIGNFINGEIFGKITSSSLGMVFPDGGAFPRYPSQLLECLLEGVVLCAFLCFIARKPQPRYRISGLFLVGYAVARIFSEFFREPDFEWGILAFGWLTMGQILCLPMAVLGLFFLYLSYKPNMSTPR